jgi:hypothetical protein
MKRFYYILLCLIGGLITSGFVSGQVAAVRFTVELPGSGIQKDSTVFLVGSFNNWNPSDSNYCMKRIDNKHYTLLVPCFSGKKYVYKYTLGSWESVEKAADGKDIDNRTFISHNRMKIKDAVVQWNHPVPAAQKETDNLLNKEQISKIMMLKDSVIKSLAPALPHLLSLLQNINTNLLTDQPDTLLEKEYNKEAVEIVSHALDSLTDAMLQIVGILSTEQKQKIKDAMKEPNAPKDIISLIMQSLNQGK